jgi:hypothetical protein
MADKLNLCKTAIQRRLFESAVDIADNAPEKISFLHTVFCQTGLPYKNPGDQVRRWERKNGAISLLVKAGEALNPESEAYEEVGLPFGPKPRLILTYLNSEAIKTQSSLIEVDNSLTAFVKRLGLNNGGRSIRTVKDQLTRLSTSDVVLGTIQDGRAFQTKANIIETFDLWLRKDVNQRVLWPSTVQLSQRYFESLMMHAVPLDERAIAALSHSAMGLDIYAWLSQRLHRVKKSEGQFIPWTSLKEQFSQGDTRMDNFKRIFRKALNMVHSQYSAARFELDNRGIILLNSPPPVKAAQILISQK